MISHCTACALVMQASCGLYRSIAVNPSVPNRTERIERYDKILKKTIPAFTEVENHLTCWPSSICRESPQKLILLAIKDKNRSTQNADKGSCWGWESLYSKCWSDPLLRIRIACNVLIPGGIFNENPWKWSFCFPLRLRMSGQKCWSCSLLRMRIA